VAGWGELWRAFSHGMVSEVLSKGPTFCLCFASVCLVPRAFILLPLHRLAYPRLRRESTARCFQSLPCFYLFPHLLLPLPLSIINCASVKHFHVASPGTTRAARKPIITLRKILYPHFRAVHRNAPKSRNVKVMLLVKAHACFIHPLCEYLNVTERLVAHNKPGPRI